MRTISFRDLKTMQSYSGCGEGIGIVEKDQTIEIIIRKQFGTPGYSMSIDKIVEDGDGNYSVYLSVTPPDLDAILSQVITYKTIIVEIDKKDLKDSPPYFFKIKYNMPSGFIIRKYDIKEY